eukprot:3311087-Prymnesium_polylepis.2
MGALIGILGPGVTSTASNDTSSFNDSRYIRQPGRPWTRTQRRWFSPVRVAGVAESPASRAAFPFGAAQADARPYSHCSPTLSLHADGARCSLAAAAITACANLDPLLSVRRI